VLSKLARLSRAADCVSDSDLMERSVRSRQAWGLLPSIAASYTRAATFAAGPTSVIQFPTWLGKNSSRTKRLRLLAELGVRISAHVSGGREAVRLDYLDALRTACFLPLARATDLTAACAESMLVLDTYSLSRVRWVCVALRVCTCYQLTRELSVFPPPFVPSSSAHLRLLFSTLSDRHDGYHGH
jgi:replication factor C subunit 1